MSTHPAVPGRPSGTTDYSVQVGAEGQVLATADVVAPTDPHGTANVTFRGSRDLPAGTRSDLVDAVLDEPGVRASDNLHAVLSLGDSESMAALQRRTDHLSARAAGASTVVDAEIPPVAPTTS